MLRGFQNEQNEAEVDVENFLQREPRLPSQASQKLASARPSPCEVDAKQATNEAVKMLRNRGAISSGGSNRDPACMSSFVGYCLIKHLIRC